MLKKEENQKLDVLTSILKSFFQHDLVNFILEYVFVFQCIRTSIDSHFYDLHQIMDEHHILTRQNTIYNIKTKKITQQNITNLVFFISLDCWVEKTSNGFNVIKHDVCVAAFDCFSCEWIRNTSLIVLFYTDAKSKIYDIEHCTYVSEFEECVLLSKFFVGGFISTNEKWAIVFHHNQWYHEPLVFADIVTYRYPYLIQIKNGAIQITNPGFKTSKNNILFINLCRGEFQLNKYGRRIQRIQVIDVSFFKQHYLALFVTNTYDHSFYLLLMDLKTIAIIEFYKCRRASRIFALGKYIVLLHKHCISCWQ